jgi:phage-related protein
MEIIADIFNAIISLLNSILGFLESVLSPVTNLIERWNGLFGSGE